ncbi:hypothetical protein GCM10010178_89500 [Lentzea flava]|uniref:Beta-carotene 15,15'-dioxygenase n=1 Tax=Lentzea flava TaxID=103732 RepID=A0ABQ2VGI6_9PSEU|nr:hypothetical protein [Lentzea flava]GGU85446.1 hypothetical protein GCM10010178_89500 [Lentzea flava]
MVTVESSSSLLTRDKVVTLFLTDPAWQHINLVAFAVVGLLAGLPHGAIDLFLELGPNGAPHGRTLAPQIAVYVLVVAIALAVILWRPVLRPAATRAGRRRDGRVAHRHGPATASRSRLLGLRIHVGDRMGTQASRVTTPRDRRHERLLGTREATTRNARLTAIRAVLARALPDHPEHAATITRVLAIPPRRRATEVDRFPHRARDRRTAGRVGHQRRDWSARPVHARA